MRDLLNNALPFFCGFLIGGGLIWILVRARLRNESEWADKFKALAADILNANNRAFLDLAESRLKQTEQSATAVLDKKTTAIDEMMKPFRESLSRLDIQLKDIELKRESAYSQLVEMVKLSHESQRELRGETGQLLQALRAPTSRGAWGQMQLRRILEMTGMAAHARDFTEQSTLPGEDGALRPDFIVSLPGNRCVVFDSKVPLSAYLDSTRCENTSDQEAHFQLHARQVRDHIRALGNKEYWSRIETTPEFVVLFMPGDHLLGTALDYDPELMEYSIKQKVVLATPTTVIALLWAVAYGWKQETLHDNVRKIGALGGDLYSSLAVMTKYFSDLGSKLSGSVKAYNDTLGSLERNVLIKARRLKDYGSGNDSKMLPELMESIEIEPRHITQDELVRNEDATEQRRRDDAA